MNKVQIFGQPESNNIFIQMVDDHDLDVIEGELKKLEALSCGNDWAVVTVHVDRWNHDLTPWRSDPVFGKEGFGDGAADTLAYLRDTVIPGLVRDHPSSDRKFFIAGYSLAGLFALWAVHETDLFSGAVAASPSVWFPGWVDFAKTHVVKAAAVYLSLGDREDKTRNQVMSRVGKNIERQYELLKEAGVRCQLDWNPGNHFKEPDLRVARGMAWMLKER